ncbi:MAG: S16 family serine protease [Candidatus Woesearchaeota archaeon]
MKKNGSRASRRNKGAALILGLFLVILFFAIPLPYYAILPGDLVSTEQLIHVENKDTHILVTSAKIAENPLAYWFRLAPDKYHLSIFGFFVSRISHTATIESIAVPMNVDPVLAQNYAQGLDVAELLAGQYLGINVTVNSTGASGGSASLPIALELVHQYGPDLVKGRKIAATGDLLENGTVVPVGGIAQKLIVAERDNVDIFIIPQQETPLTKLNIVKVNTFSEAVEALQ